MIVGQGESIMVAAPRPLPASLYGWTTDDGYATTRLVDAASHMKKMSTVRVVFDEWVKASAYVPTVKALYPKAYVMGELLDSAYVRDYSTSQYAARTTEYLNAMGPYVDIWEIGNEVNGEWLGSTASVVAKITDAYNQVKSRGLRAALTLYYNPNCYENMYNEMFKWIPNIPERIRTGLDYLFISYYEQDCENQKFDEMHWNKVFNSLRLRFPNSKLGFGEMGSNQYSSNTTRAEVMRRYYPMKIYTPGYVGFYGWWYGYQHLTPWNTKPLFSVFNEVIQKY